MRRRIIGAGTVLLVLGAAGVAGALTVIERPNPGERFPRRPGASYFDREIADGEWARLSLLFGAAALDLPVDVRPAGWQVEAQDAVAGRFAAPDPSALRDEGVIDGFSAYAYEPGDVLHVTIELRAVEGGDVPAITPDAASLRCSAVDASDGTELLAYDDPARVPDATNGASATTTTPDRAVAGRSPGATAAETVVADAYIGIGTRRGAFYVRCGTGLWGLTGGRVGGGAVWRIDVA